MIEVKEVLKIGGDKTVLICDVFSDDAIKGVLKSNIGEHKAFTVEKPKHCLSEPKSRHIVLFGNDDYSGIKRIQFV